MTRALRAHPVPALCAALWIAAQIGYPLAEGAARDRLTVTVVLLSAATALTHAAVTRGPLFAAGFLAAVAGPGLLAEVLGTATGYPFGCYAYATDRIGPALADVPLLVPLAWAGGLYPVWIVAGALFGRGLPRIAATAIGGVGWDLFLDPQMVADGQWSWCVTDAGLPGVEVIPVTNYLGWFAVGLVMAALLEMLDRSAPAAEHRIAGIGTTDAESTAGRGRAAADPDRLPTDAIGRADATIDRRETSGEPAGIGTTGDGRSVGRPGTSTQPAGSERIGRPTAGRVTEAVRIVSNVESSGPYSAANAVPIVVYLWTWLGSTLAHAVFLGLPASAVYGAFGMAVVGVPLLVGLGRQVRSAGSRAG
ncbi:carotenoid biosynthesis protein [Nocardia takedensis]